MRPYHWKKFEFVVEWSNFSQPMYYTIVATQIDIKGWCRHIAVCPCQCINFNSLRNQPVLVSSHCAALPLYKFQFVAEYVVWFISECGYTDDSHLARSIRCVCCSTWSALPIYCNGFTSVTVDLPASQIVAANWIAVWLILSWDPSWTQARFYNFACWNKRQYQNHSMLMSSGALDPHSAAK